MILLDPEIQIDGLSLTEHAEEAILADSLQVPCPDMGTTEGIPAVGADGHRVGSVSRLSFMESSPYMAGLDWSEKTTIAEYICERDAGRGETIIHEGNDGEAVYFVVSGAVKCFKTSRDGREQILQIVLPGDSFNDSVIADDHPNPASAEAISPSRLYYIARSDMRRVMVDHPRVAVNAATIFSQRIRQLVELVEDLSFRQVTSRLARLLLDYANSSDGMKLKLTHAEIAAAVGTVREVAGRSLKALHDENAIRMDRNRIVVLDRQSLEMIAGSPN